MSLPLRFSSDRLAFYTEMHLFNSFRNAIIAGFNYERIWIIDDLRFLLL